MSDLNKRQQRFVDEYLANGGNATQAAIAAKYSDKTAEATASRLLRNVKVAAAINSAQEIIKKDLGVTAEWKREQLKEIVLSCTQKVSVIKKKGDSEAKITVMDDPKAAISAIAELNKMDGDLAAIKTENTNTHKFEELSEQDLNARIADLTRKT